MKKGNYIARAYLAEDQICFYFQPCWEKYEFLIQIPLGQEICNFIAPDREQTEAAFKMAKFIIKESATGSYDILQINRQLNQIFLPLAQINPYLFLYIENYLEGFFDRTDTMTELLTDDTGVQSVLERQSELKKDMEAVLKNKDDLKEFSPLQRLYLMSKNKKLSANYIETDFRSSLQTAEVFVKEDYDSIKKHIHVHHTQIVEMYELKTIEEALRFEFVQMIAKDMKVKVCKYCGKYFIPTVRSDAEYCNRKVNGTDKTCREIGPTILFKEKHENDEIHKIYRTAYARMDSRKRQGMITKKEFNAWSFEAREKRTDCINGAISLQEFQEWLDQTRWR